MIKKKLMINTFKNIRNGVRAVIKSSHGILFIQKKNEVHGEYFVLPGGIQTPGESLIDALRRECREEIGAEITVGSLLHVGDRYKVNSKASGAYQHNVEFLFSCHVGPDYQPQNGSAPDKKQMAVLWLPLEQLLTTRLRPHSLAKVLIAPSQLPLYLGAMGDLQ